MGNGGSIPPTSPAGTPPFFDFFFFFCGFKINESEFYLSFCKKSSLVLVVWLCSVVSDYLSEVHQMLPDCFVRFVKD